MTLRQPRTWTVIAGALIASTGLVLGSASAQPAAPSTPESLNVAKSLFRKGVALYGAGDIEKALEYFLRSRAEYASSKNLINAALCLTRLGRDDEAFEVYEEVLASFTHELEPGDLAAMRPAMQELRQRMGRLDLTANVDGQLVVDGRVRGKLPLPHSIPVTVGRRMVRVVKDGYVTFSKQIDVVADRTILVESNLTPMGESGQLRIEEVGERPEDVYIDGALVGTTSWEGTLRPGPHVVWTLRGDSGSAPQRLIVVQGQTTLVRVRSVPLGTRVRIGVAPTVEVTLDGVTLGNGGREARVPPGAHRLSLREEGYLGKTVSIVVPPAGAPPMELDFRLDIDQGHPRWPKRGQPIVESTVGYALGGTLAGGAERHCPSRCINDPSVYGVVAALRGGYRFHSGISLELTGGVMRLGLDLAREVVTNHATDAKRVTVQYHLRDAIRVAGPLFGAGAGYHLPLGERFVGIARVTVGVLIARSTDPITGTATANGMTAPISVTRPDAAVRSAAAFVLPEIGYDVHLGRVRLGASFGAAVFPTQGAVFDHRAVAVPLRCTSAHPGTIGCAPNVNIVGNERAYGAFVVWVPQLRATYTL